MRGFFSRHAETHYLFTFQIHWALYKHPELHRSKKGEQDGL